jgi:hypothetical protein
MPASLHNVFYAIRRLHWHWAVLGLVWSVVDFFIVPFNLAFISPVYMWLLWLLVPWGMYFRLSPMPFWLGLVVWVGMPLIYGLLLTFTSRTRWERFTRWSLLIMHTSIACLAAFS